MNEHTAQLVAYIRHSQALGVPAENIKDSLLDQNWEESLIDQAFTAAGHKHPKGHHAPALQAIAQPSAEQIAAKNKRLFRALCWIFSPLLFMVVAVVYIMSVIISHAEGPVTSVIAFVIGIATVISMFAGPIVGIIKLTKKD